MLIQAVNHLSEVEVIHGGDQVNQPPTIPNMLPDDYTSCIALLPLITVSLTQLALTQIPLTQLPLTQLPLTQILLTQLPLTQIPLTKDTPD